MNHESIGKESKEKKNERAPMTNSPDERDFDLTIRDCVLCFLLSVVCRVAWDGIREDGSGEVQCSAVRCGVIKFARVLALFSVRRRDAYLRARERVLRVSVLDGD